MGHQEAETSSRMLYYTPHQAARRSLETEGYAPTEKDMKRIRSLSEYFRVFGDDSVAYRVGWLGILWDALIEKGFCARCDETEEYLGGLLVLSGVAEIRGNCEMVSTHSLRSMLDKKALRDAFK